MSNQQKNISNAAKGDVKRLEKSMKAMNLWYVLALYLLLALGSVVVIWAAYSKGISAPYMYVIACVTLIAGVTFRYFAVTKVGRFIVGLFAFVYSVFWIWVVFNQAINGVMIGSTSQNLIFPAEFYLSGGIFSLATLMFMVQPFVQLRRKRLVKKVIRHVESTQEITVQKTEEEPETTDTETENNNQDT